MDYQPPFPSPFASARSPLPQARPPPSPPPAPHLCHSWQGLHQDRHHQWRDPDHGLFERQLHQCAAASVRPAARLLPDRVHCREGGLDRQRRRLGSGYWQSGHPGDRHYPHLCGCGRPARPAANFIACKMRGAVASVTALSSPALERPARAAQFPQVTRHKPNPETPWPAVK
jgi:hypothetical protein